MIGAHFSLPLSFRSKSYARRLRTFFPPTALTPLVAASTLAPRVWKNGAVPVKDDFGLFKAGLALAHDPVRLARWLRRDTVAEQELKEKWLTNQGKAKKRKIS